MSSEETSLGAAKRARKSRFPSDEVMHRILEAIIDPSCNESEHDIEKRTGQAHDALRRYTAYKATRGLIENEPRAVGRQVPRIREKGRALLSAYRTAAELVGRPGVRERL